MAAASLKATFYEIGRNRVIAVGLGITALVLFAVTIGPSLSAIR